MASLGQLRCESFTGPSARGDEGGVEEEEGGDTEGEREAQLEPDDGAVQERGGRPHQQEVDGRDQGMTGRTLCSLPKGHSLQCCKF